MLIKAGVDISRLKKPIRKALTKIACILVSNGVEFVITSTYEGNHTAGSLHYANMAFDFRKRSLLWKKNIDKTIVQEIRIALGSDYDIIDERDHIHVEYDPK